jgi:hypothetical protein
VIIGSEGLDARADLDKKPAVSADYEAAEKCV